MVAGARGVLSPEDDRVRVAQEGERALSLSISGARSESPAEALPSVARIRPGQALGRPIRLAVLSNPASGGNRRGAMGSLRARLAAAGVAHGEAREPAELSELASRCVADGVELLVVNGGDGTVQAALTGVLGAGSAGLPVLALLPGGSTNTSARNVGYATRSGDALRELLQQAAAGRLEGRLEARPAIRVERAGEPRARFAMFFGAGCVYHGIRFAKQRVETRGLRGPLGAAVALGFVFARLARGRAQADFPPLRVRGSVDGLALPRTPQLALFCSTMEEQFLGLRPFWGHGPGPLRLTCLDYRPRRYLRATLPVLRGRPNRHVRPENGYRSWNAQRVDLSIDSGYTLDGELFERAPDGGLCLSAGREAFFLRGSAPA